MAAILAYTSLTISAIITAVTTTQATITTSQCGYVALVANEDTSYLTSPNYPSNYPSNTDCLWTITASISTKVIVLHLFDLYLDNPTSASCIHDYVSIHDGHSRYSPKLDVLCGQVFNKTYMSTGNSLTIKFYSNPYDNFKGFKFGYSSVDKPGQCADVVSLVASEDTNYLISPNYLSNYPRNNDCMWKITASDLTKIVVLHLDNLNLANPTSVLCSQRHLTIYDGNSKYAPVLAVLCGRVVNKTYTSTGNSLTVVLHVNYYDSLDGFKFEFKAIDRPNWCGDTYLWANGSAQFIPIPDVYNTLSNNDDYDTFIQSDPIDYSKRVYCQWIITAVDKSDMIALEVTDLYLNTNSEVTICNNNYLNIYDGNNTGAVRIQSLCGSVSSRHIKSSGSSMTVIFRSISRYTPFKLQFTSQKKTAQCGDSNLRAETSAQFITQPKYNYSPLRYDYFDYNTNTECKWLITVYEEGHVVVLNVLYFYLENLASDGLENYVTLYDGDTTSAKIDELRGTVRYVEYTSSYQYMTIVLHSKYINNSTMFKFQYTSQKKPTCEDTNLVALSTYQYIRSPHYPYKYSSVTNCLWYIITDDKNSVIELSISDFSVDQLDNSCSHDYVTIYDGYFTDSPKIKSLCGYIYSGTYRSTGQAMTIEFHSDWKDNYEGFSIAYRTRKDDQSLSSIGITFRKFKYIIGVTAGGIALIVVTVVSIVCVARRARKRRQTAGRETSLFIVGQRNIPPTRSDLDSSYEAMLNSDNTCDPPPYSSLNYYFIHGLTDHVNSDPPQNEKDQPPPYLTICNEQQTNTLQSNEILTSPNEIHSIPGNGALINMGFNFTSTDELMTIQNVPANIGPATNASFEATKVMICSSSDPKTESPADNTTA